MCAIGLILTVICCNGAFFFQSESIAQTGRLTCVQLLNGGVNPHWYGHIGSIVVSPDGRHVYVPGDKRVGVLIRDPETGELARSKPQDDWQYEDVPEMHKGNGIAVTPDGQNVYLTGGSGLAVTARDSATGALSFIEVHPVRGSAILVSPDNRHVYATAGDSLVVAQRDTATGRLAILESYSDNVNGIDGLAGANSMAITADGAFIYVTGGNDNAVAGFSRDSLTGALTFLQSYINGHNGVENIGGARAATLSPDDTHLYVAGPKDSSVAVFVRDVGTGLLTLAGSISEGDNGIEGLKHVHDITISPDGLYLYTTSNNDIWGYPDDPTVAVFLRDMHTGTLQYVERYMREHIQHIMFNTAPVQDILVSPDGLHVYIVEGDGICGTLAFARDTTGMVNSAPIPALEVTPSNGTISTEFTFDASAVSDLEEPSSALRVHWDWGSDGEWDTDLSTMKTQIYRFNTPGLYTVTMEVRDSEGLWRRAQGTIDVDLDAPLPGCLTHVYTLTDSSITGEGLTGAHDIAFSPDGKHVYAATRYANGYGEGAVVALARDTTTGELSYIETYIDWYTRDIEAIAVSPGGGSVYTVGKRWISVFARNDTTGRLNFLQEMRNGEYGVTYPRRIAIDRNELHIYIAGDGGVFCFARDTLSGHLTFVEKTQHRSSTGVKISPDDRYVYVLNKLVDVKIVTYSRNESTGMLTLIDEMDADTVNSPQDINISPDGNHVYVIGNTIKYPFGVYEGVSSIGVFARDMETGKLTIIDVLKNTINGVHGLNNASTLTISPDGAHLYVLSDDYIYDSSSLMRDRTLATFIRDKETGLLAFLENHRNGENGLQWLYGGNSSVRVSPDGAYVYVASPGPGAITMFSRLTDITTSIDGIAHHATTPITFQLYQNYPNPFNSSTVIRYNLAQATHIRLSIYNLLGQEVTNLVDDWQEAGAHSVTWNASGLPSGLYFIRMSTPQYAETRKTMLLK